MIKPTLEEVKAIDLSPLYPLTKDNDDNRRLFKGEAGVEHYKLLAWISEQFVGATIIEIGTLGGLGTIALSFNPKNHVISFDIRNYKWGNTTPENAEKKIVYDGYMDEVMKSPVIFYDAAHEGMEEMEFLGELRERGWKGIIVWDDIHLNKEMETFWKHCVALSQVTESNMVCEDWSSLGHQTGSGVLYLK